jgi:uncharacterized repeat protein (TIGR03803 family)
MVILSGIVNSCSAAVMKNNWLRIAGLVAVVMIAFAGRGHGGELALQRLVTFSMSDDDSQPTSLIQGLDGNFYGTTSGSFGSGGHPTNGLVFQLTPGGELTVLASFDPSGTNGCCPGALVQAEDGSFYGATWWRETNYGGIFHLKTNGELNVIFSFNSTNGRAARVLIYGGDGNLYGTTDYGGPAGTVNWGTIFKLTTAGNFTALFSFSRTNGINPTSLLRASDGTLYGTTSDWIGVNAPDTVFKLSPSGELLTLVSSHSSVIRRPWSPIIGADGNIYALDGGGDTNSFGSIFKVTPSGALTVLAHFNGTNGWGPDRLIQGLDGSLYGTTGAGGIDFAGWIPDEDGDLKSTGSGTIFKLTPAGELSALAYFQELPGNGVVSFLQTADDVFYGANTSGNPEEAAGIFRLAPRPRISAVHHLDGGDVVSWTAFPGGVYEIEHNHRCAAGSWTALPGAVTSSGTVAAATNSVSGGAQGYYRVRLLP